MRKVLFILTLIFLAFTQVSAQTQKVSAIGPIVRFYPNPATTSVTFDFQKNYEKGYSIQIFSFLGKKMYQAGNLSQTTIINLSDFDRGVYIYQIFNKNGKMIECGKFQVSR